ncbi:MAG: hypothetical protein P8X66_07940, partial [Maritimibacter sp.]
MKRLVTWLKSEQGMIYAIGFVILLQGLAGLFFMSDVAEELIKGDFTDTWHLWLEAFATLALLSGIALLVVEMRRLLMRMVLLNRSMQAARGEMAEV